MVKDTAASPSGGRVLPRDARLRAVVQPGGQMGSRSVRVALESSHEAVGPVMAVERDGGSGRSPRGRAARVLGLAGTVAVWVAGCSSSTPDLGGIRADEEEAEGRRATLKGKVGEGPTIKLTANHGWVSVRKEGTMPSEVLPDSSRDHDSRRPAPPRPPKPPRELKDSEIKM